MSKDRDPFYLSLIECLREARLACELTQADVAGRLGRTQAFVSRYEGGLSTLDISQLRAIASSLGVEWHQLNRDAQERMEAGASALINQTRNADPLDSLPASDREWSEEDWHFFLDYLVEMEVVNYREATALLLGHLNPSQVGTSVASKRTFQQQFGKGKCWSAVRTWHFDQVGRCADCGTRLELQADHVETRADFGDGADRLENLTLRCRRCNVIRRPSHKQGGLTFLTAESALMWLLFTKRPRTYQEFEKLCRAYGLTMANIRFQEAWAMARWLNREQLYEIDPGSKY